MRSWVFQMGMLVGLHPWFCPGSLYADNRNSAYGSIACTGIAFQIFFTGYKLASAKDRKLRSQYMRCSVLVGTLWLGYGIIWPLGEGANVVSPDVESVLYGFLDIVGCIGF